MVFLVDYNHALYVPKCFLEGFMSSVSSFFGIGKCFVEFYLDGINFVVLVIFFDFEPFLFCVSLKYSLEEVFEKLYSEEILYESVQKLRILLQFPKFATKENFLDRLHVTLFGFWKLKIG